MNTTTTTAHAPIVRFERLGGSVAVYCPSGHKVGQADVIRGFAHYFGAKGSAHEGVTAVVRGGLEGLEKALAQGLRSGRNDAR